MSNSNKKRTTKVQLTDKQQKAVENRSLKKPQVTMQEIAAGRQSAKHKAKEVIDSLS